MKNKLQQRILVLIPAYNEARTIAGLIAEIRSLKLEADVVVVNDGSSDATVLEATKAGAVVISHPFNMGYGVTVQTGYKYASRNNYEVLVQIDGDGQHDPACIPRLIAQVCGGEIDIALGSRFLESGSYRPPFARRVGMALFSRLIKLLTGLEISDPTSGYQAFNRRVMDFYVSDIFPCDYPDADVLLMLALTGFRLREVPVRMTANSEGKSMHSGLKPLYYMFKMLLSMSVILMRNRGGRSRRGGTANAG